MYINREEEIKWRTKSRQLWLKGGDKNTAYFHKQAIARKIRNNVSSIINNEGNKHNKQENIKKAASSHYRDLLTESQGEEDYSDLLQYLPKGITKDLNDMLNREIDEEEIKRTIWTLQPDKAPGPDGFPICFYREFWHLIKKDLTKMLRGVQRKGKMGGFTNSTFLALIPKENRPTSFSRFRPISLCNSSYKIFTKILATRLKPLLPTLISENQGGFISNRQIHDSIILVQEAIHSSLSRQEKGFVLKLDLANAFDRVRHSFLFAILKKMGFDSSFINTIAACISGPWISALINGRPCDAFQSSRGLRQGCPLSPYLFILMAESFSKVLDHNKRVGLITGIKYGNRAKNINHSQFADDTLLIGGASTTIAKRFKTLLDQYMHCSGGAVNYQKSCVYGWNITNQVAHSIASIFGVTYKIKWEHFSYLGMPVSLGPLKAEAWDEIIDKVKRKIQQWGTLWLNPAGRLILLNSGITYLPLYRFTLYQAPAIFHHKLEVALRHFLWQGGKKEKSRFNLVNWKNVIQAQDRGGLGIRAPKILNLAFGVKMVWRLITGPTAWWKQVMETKYLNSPRKKLLDASIPNRDSSKIWCLCKRALHILKQNTLKIPGGGESINFASDRIMGLAPLNTIEDAIPIILVLNSRGIHSLDQISKWDPCSHAWTGWAFPEIPAALEASLNAFKKHLHNRAPIRKDEIDGLCWDPSGSTYTIKSGHHYLCNNTFQMPLWNHWKITWRSEALPKIIFFIWLLLKGKILTAENLSKRGINGPSICPNCCTAEETMCHLFVECPFARECWNQLSSLGNTIWNPQQSVAETIYVWKKSCPWREKWSSLAKRVWDTLPHTLLWRIWLSRNKKKIQDKNPNVRITCSKAKSLAHEAIAINTTGKIQAREFTVEERNIISHILERSNCHSLYFDGASKSNPSQAGAGGLIMDEKGDTILSYEWSLGKRTNNSAEALALYQGLTQLRNLGIKNATIFGDSSIIIRLMTQNRSSPNSILQQVIHRNRVLLKNFEEIQFYHILRNLNKEADSRENSACGRQIDVLRCNAVESLQPIP
eukprot:PITA_18691